MYAYLGNKCNLKAIFDHLRNLDLQAITSAGSMQALFARTTTTAQLEAAVATSDNITMWAVSQVEAWQARPKADQERVSQIDSHESFFNWGIQNKIWKDDALPDYDMPNFKAALIHRYSPSKSVLFLDKNCGPRRGSGWLITWAKWRDQLVRHHYMRMAQEESTGEQEGAVQEEAVEEVEPTPLTQFLDQASKNASGSNSDDDGQY